MKILAVKLYDGGFMTQPFALGGEESRESFDANIKYRSSLQNYVIDTGSEVILVDTGLPEGVPETEPKPESIIYMGKKLDEYLPALAKLGYKPQDVTKILLTHKHADHSGMLAAFPDAKIYMSPEEAEAKEITVKNVVTAEYKDGAYHNFEKSEKIADGVYFLPAKGHTKGNSIVIAEDGGLFYMIHGDVTYTDEALYLNKLSIVFEDKDAARQTLDKVREFIRNNPTVYLSTHTPLGYENLESKRITDLDNMPESIYPNM